MINAHWTNRKGASCFQQNISMEEAERLLRGGRNATDVRLVYADGGQLAGLRWKDNGRWNWFYEKEAFNALRQT